MRPTKLDKLNALFNVVKCIACVAGARKGKGEGKSDARGKGKATFSFSPRATQAIKYINTSMDQREQSPQANNTTTVKAY